LRPKFLLIKEADRDTIDAIVDEVFNKDNKALQKVLMEDNDAVQ